MSWQTYVDEHLMCEIEGHHLTSAAIIGHDGTVWAQSTAFPQVSARPFAHSFLPYSFSLLRRSTVRLTRGFDDGSPP
jgi:hypothetical protein